ncbi:MAG: haloacid dehalogenase type II [Bacteroidetes bacterium]|nr:haloacid dehalogenase type II [Bacteroidota bacterium]
MKRREFLVLTQSAALGLLASSAMADTRTSGRFKAVAFDAFPILDPRPVFETVEKLFPGKGAALSNVWKARQFEYMWLRSLEGQYADFETVTADALVFAAKATGVELTTDAKTTLPNAYFNLKAFPDVAPALARMKELGLTICFLSNATERILRSGLKNSGLTTMFDAVISTDTVKAYKPEPRAYQLGVDVLKLRKDQILFVAFAGWDAAGAKAFGYPTYWLNRLGSPAEELGPGADATGRTMGDLVRFIESSR